MPSSSGLCSGMPKVLKDLRLGSIGVTWSKATSKQQTPVRAPHVIYRDAVDGGDGYSIKLNFPSAEFYQRPWGDQKEFWTVFRSELVAAEFFSSEEDRSCKDFAELQADIKAVYLLPPAQEIDFLRADPKHLECTSRFLTGWMLVARKLRYQARPKTFVRLKGQTVYRRIRGKTPSWAAPVHGRYARKVEKTIQKAQQSREPANARSKFAEVCKSMVGDGGLTLSNEAISLLQEAAEDMAVSYLRALQGASSARGAVEIKPRDVATVRAVLQTAGRWQMA
ncbi:unnamed protein product [Symbiodinium sp. CCMP2592]|nr:unnamed protein product [Symbiodinium sp. CCMP2592]